MKSERIPSDRAYGIWGLLVMAFFVLKIFVTGMSWWVGLLPFYGGIILLLVIICINLIYGKI